MARLLFCVFLCFFSVSDAGGKHVPEQGRSLKKELSILRTALDRIEKKVDDKAARVSPKTPDPVQRFQSLVALRFQRIVMGIDALSLAIKPPVIDDIVWRYDIIVALCMGVFFFVGIRFFVRRFVVRQQSTRVTDPVRHASILTAAIFVPFLVYAVYCVLVSVVFFLAKGFWRLKKSLPPSWRSRFTCIYVGLFYSGQKWSFCRERQAISWPHLGRWMRSTLRFGCACSACAIF